MYVIKEPTQNSFEKVGINGKIFPISDLTAKSEFVLVQTQSGHETTIIEHDSDFIYYVLEGEGYFLIEDQKESCAQGDLVVIPAGKKFTYKGNLKLLLSCTPPWTQEQEETL
ncbi:MAG: cupin domain-containing protein [Candidatus Levyibacteriota bacterium]